LLANLIPKAEYADEVLNSVSCMTTTQIAKEMNMTGRELNNLLCQMHIQYKQSGQYMLYAKYARKGLARNRSHVFYDLFGTVYTKPYMVWTELGRRYIHYLVNNNFNTFLL
jgi:phage antirepressor YoqD-like protein